MSWVLLVGAALNFGGAVRFADAAWRDRDVPAAGRDDLLQLRLFVAGVAATFGAMYVVLYAEPEHVRPFLFFGAALKTWAFVLSAGLAAGGRAGRRQLLEFGATNGAVAALFWAYLATAP